MKDSLFPRRFVLRTGLVLGLGLVLSAHSVRAQENDFKTSLPPAAAAQVILPHTRFATRCYDFQSGVPGPTVLVVGGMNGDEPAGAFAAEAIRHWSVRTGRLVVIPAANVTGLAAAQRGIAGAATNLSELNRDFPLAQQADNTARGEPAQAIWKIAVEDKADWVLDLHEGHDSPQENGQSAGSSIICFPIANAPAVTDALLAAVNATITGSALQFVRRDLPADGSLARAAGEHLHVPGLTVETIKAQPLATQIRQHEIIVHALLEHLGMTAGPFDPAAPPVSTNLAALIAPPKIMVAMYKGPGTGGDGPPNLLRRLNSGTETSLTEVTPQEIRDGVLTNYDVVIFAGGSGSREAAAIGETGRAQVEKFVAGGGGYVGICAGAYLATSGYPWSLHLINAKTLSPKWERGKARLRMEITPAGAAILAPTNTQVVVLYHNGPVVGPAKVPGLPPYEPLAFFRTETAEHDSPKGIQVNSPAIFAAPYKQGRVVCISPHPEQTEGLDFIAPRAVEWVAAAAANGQ